ncbi:hypothetical protein BBJ28_00023529 [Nothophytophthora sp. Chile5]|nr:hypothetical protein BBJ28_00023529 [Nothophytophthora sp. Chile5]
MAQDATHSREQYSVLVDFAAGVVGGCSGIVVGQPFDTTSNLRLLYLLQLQHEGVRGFFKGMTSPLVGSAWTNAIMFATYERSLQLIDSTPQTPTLQSVFYAGTIGGFCQTVALTPAELIKCRLQVQDGHESTRYRGPWDCVKHIYQRNGLRGLFLGYTCTLWREVPSFAFYFSMYEYTKRKMMAHGINPHTSMLTAGGLAGVGSWIIAYPMDVLKSSIQTLPVDHRPGEHKMAYQARRLYRLGGLRIFVNGLETAVVRAFPVNAVTFYCYEKTSESLKGLTRD